MTRHSGLVAASLAGIYAALLLAVPAAGEFPLNDDWAYAWSVRELLSTGQLRISEWTSATVLFPVYWGALFCAWAGEFSFTALRWSTIAMSAVGCVAVYDLFRQLQLSVRSSGLAMVVVATNPIYVYLGYTFLSDVFYFAPMVACISFYVRGVRHRSTSNLLIGSVLAAVAYLARQIAFTLPLAVAVALVLRDRRLSWRPIATAVVLPAVVFVVHTGWLTYVHGVPWGLQLNAVQNSVASLFQPGKPLEIGWRLLMSLTYLGIFTLPATVAVVVSAWRDHEQLFRLKRSFVVWSLLLVALMVGLVAVRSEPMPYLQNVINRLGIGALTLPGEKAPVTATWIFWLVTAVAPFAGAVQGALWTEAIFKARRERDDAGFVLLIASVLMALLTAAIVYLWDEYLLVFLPAALYLVLRLESITIRGALIGGALALVMFAYAVTEMRDYMAWNAARWAAGRQLVAQGVRPEAIAGGFEWVGWHEFADALPVAVATGEGQNLFGWMNMTPDVYYLAFSPLPGYEVVESRPYRGSTRDPRRRIYVLTRTTP